MTKDEYITHEIQVWLKKRKPGNFALLANEIALKVQEKFGDDSYLFKSRGGSTIEFKCYIDDRIKQIKNNIVGMF